MKLQLKNLTVQFKENTVLNDLNLSVRKGEFMSLLGPSGCGKSTMLKTIAGLAPLKSGKIYLDGREISSEPAYKRGAVIVFQDMRLFPHMSVIENVAFSMKMQGKTKKERLSEAERFLDSVKLSGCENRKISEISGGQQQRVALARALAALPQLLLLDEPFSSLDENLREEMRSLILSIHKDFGMTTIMVTHDRIEALRMSDKVAVMFAGKIHQVGKPADVIEKPSTPEVRSYLGNLIHQDYLSLYR